MISLPRRFQENKNAFSFLNLFKKCHEFHTLFIKQIFRAYCFHLSSTLALITAAFVSHFFEISKPLLFFQGTISVLLLIFLGKKQLSIRFISIFIIVFTLFALRYHSPRSQMQAISLEKNDFFLGKVVSIEGFITRRYTFKIRLEKIVPKNSNTPVTHFSKQRPIYAVVSSRMKFDNLHIGDVLKIHGNVLQTLWLKKSSYKNYLIKETILAKIFINSAENIEVLEKSKSNFLTRTFFQKIIKEKIDTHVSFPANTLCYALITGDKHPIPKSIKNYFKQTGTYHVLAVSGMHASIISLLFFMLFRFLRFRKRMALLIVLFCILPFYLFLAGNRVSLERTYLMIFIGISIGLLERKISIFIKLQMAFFILVMQDPKVIYSLSLQLSFAAVFGIFLTLKTISVYTIKNKFLSLLLVGIGVHFFTAPLIRFYFSHLSHASVVYNLFIPSFITFSLALTILLLFSPVSLISSVFGNLLNALNSLIFNSIAQTYHYVIFSEVTQKITLIDTILQMGFQILLFYFFCFTKIFYNSLAGTKKLLKKKATLSEEQT